jgi:hypothetical protein
LKRRESLRRSSSRIDRKKTVTKKRNSFKELANKLKKHSADDLSQPHIKEKFKGFDSRCKDELDELKMIFYKFFVPEANKDQATLDRDQLEKDMEEHLMR